MPKNPNPAPDEAAAQIVTPEDPTPDIMAEVNPPVSGDQPAPASDQPATDENPTTDEAAAQIVTPLLWIRNQLVKAGESIAGLFTRAEHEEAYQAAAQEVEDEQAESPIHWRWLSEDSGEGPAEAVDPAGNWSVRVFPDGGAEITLYAAPNLHNRVPGQVFANDQTLKVPSLPELAHRLRDAFYEGSAIIETSLAKIAEAKAAVPVPVEFKPDQDADIETIRAYAETIGIDVSDDLLPQKVAEALWPTLEKITEPSGELMPFDQAKAVVAAAVAELAS